jgi:hypothetical protein
MKQVILTYLKVYGLATSVILFGYIVGRNVLFSPHGGLGWFLVPLAIVGGITVGAIDTGMQPRGAKGRRAVEIFLGLVVFIILTTLLAVCMPNAWNNWIIKYPIVRH